MEMKELWERACALMESEMNRIVYNTWIADNLTVTALEGDTLRIRLDKAFAAHMFNSTTVTEQIRDAASRCAGRPIRVEMAEMDAHEQINQRSIDELARFGNVTIK